MQYSLEIKFGNIAEDYPNLVNVNFWYGDDKTFWFGDKCELFLWLNKYCENWTYAYIQS